jgi:hypothetical protein
LTGDHDAQVDVAGRVRGEASRRRDAWGVGDLDEGGVEPAARVAGKADHPLVARAEEQGRARPQAGELLYGYLLDGVAKVFRVVEGDVGEHDGLGPGDGGGIVACPESGFQDGPGYLRFGEHPQSSRGQDLELRYLDAVLVGKVYGLPHRGRKPLLGSIAAPQHYAFGVGEDVRREVRAGGVARLFQGAGQGYGGGALAVRPHDLHHVGDFALRVAHRFQEGFDPFETEGNLSAPVQLGADLGITG